MSEQAPVIGIVGSAGAYGRWLQRFFTKQMGLQVIGHDPADPASASPQQVIAQARVIIFSVPIRHTAQIIGDWIALAEGREAGQLWLDITSVKQAPVQALLASRAEVAGLHPMCAPPKSPTLKGRALVVCAARISRWQAWLDDFCAALQAQCVQATPEHHDRMMALVQAMVHACGLAQAGVLRQQQGWLGALEAVLPFRTVGFEMHLASMARILALNPAIYEDIQFGNPYVAPMLAQLSGQLQQLQALVQAGDQAARDAFRAQFLQAGQQAFGPALVASGNYGFERIGYLLADLAGERAVSVYLPEDRPGSLRVLLAAFEQAGVNLTSIHSSRTPAGELHFRLGIDGAVEPDLLQQALRMVEQQRLGRVLAD